MRVLKKKIKDKQTELTKGNKTQCILAFITTGAVVRPRLHTSGTGVVTQVAAPTRLVLATGALGQAAALGQSAAMTTN